MRPLASVHHQSWFRTARIGLLLFFWGGSVGPTAFAASADLAETFRQPPRESGVWVYWWWLNGYVCREGLLRELDEMKRQGLAGAAVFHGGSTVTPKSTRFMSEEWRGHFRFAVEEAAKRGLKISLNLCAGWNAGGPWITEDLASAFLQHSTLVVEGPTRVRQPLPEFKPADFKTHSRDLFVYAWQKRDGVCDPASFRDLTHCVDATGHIDWEAPSGQWLVVRFGRFIHKGRGYTKHSYHPSWIQQPEFDGNEMDPEVARVQFRHTAQVLIDELRPHVGRTWTDVFLDSSETGRPDWSRNFLADFERLRSYDARPFFAAKAGQIVGSREITERFLEDYSNTQSDLICDGYYAEFTRLAAAHGLGTHAQAAGHQKPTVDALRALGANAAPMGEFWFRVPGVAHIHQAAQVQLLTHDSIKAAASAAHTYGRRLVCAEAFSATYTQMAYSQAPFHTKAAGDRALAQGLNRMVICYFGHQPEGTAASPGYAGFPHIISANDVWWEWADDWFTYLHRCQELLQAGTFVADVCYFQGEWTPVFVPARWRMNPSLPQGYDCDTATAQILVEAAQVDARGRLRLRGDTSYGYLALAQSGRWRLPPPTQLFPKPPDLGPVVTRWPEVASGQPLALRPETVERLRSLVERGVTLIGPPPHRSIGLRNFPREDERTRAVAREIWGENPGPEGERKLGRGRVIWGRSLRAVLAADGLPPDVEYKEDAATAALPLPIEPPALIPEPCGFDWIHRRIGEADVYFLVNYREVEAGATFTFRQSGRRPELWDPLTGESRSLSNYSPTADGRIMVPLRFAPRQSFFVAFRHPLPSAAPAGPMPVPSLRVLREFPGEWKVTFDPRRGGPTEPVVFPSLTDWTGSPDDRIRHYSGIARYERRFTWGQDATAAVGPVYLDVGCVEIMARVTLNGRLCGTLWTAPWRVDVTDALRPGENRLVIEVVNLYRNRIIGDADKPESERLTRVSFPVRRGDKLAPSGLLGPVTLQAFHP